jgi:hypothetical protein
LTAQQRSTVASCDGVQVEQILLQQWFPCADKVETEAPNMNKNITSAIANGRTGLSFNE